MPSFTAVPEQPPKSAAQILATEALKSVKEAIERADQAAKDALAPTAEFEKELPGDAAHPLATLIQAREQLANARRAVACFLDYGTDNPSWKPLGAMIGQAQAVEAFRPR